MGANAEGKVYQEEVVPFATSADYLFGLRIALLGERTKLLEVDVDDTSPGMQGLHLPMGALMGAREALEKLKL